MKKKKGDRHFTEEGRGAEITVHLVLQAKAQLSENKFNGRNDQAVAFGEDLHPHEVFSGTLLGPDGSTKFMGDRETSVLTKKPDAAPKKESEVTSSLR